MTRRLAVAALTLVAPCVLVLPTSLIAQERPGPSPTSASATRAAVATAAPAPDPVIVDGRADDAVWRTAPRQRGFRTFEPRVDATPTQETEFQVAFDARNLYVFVRMFDSAPDSIMRALSRRDVRGPSDQIKLLIDSYNDKRSGYEFAVNPDGVKRDYVMSNDGDEDESWDGIWDVATAIDDQGWTAEFRIPLSQLRYAPAEEHTFGFGLWRDFERLKERSAWPLWSPTVRGLSSQLGQLVGLRGLTSARRLEVIPYVVTKNLREPSVSDPFARSQELTVGGDLKLGLTPNITLDATVNPDFGQVEADPAVVNLTAFEQFFSERRPFFIEGGGFYQFPLNCYIVVDCSTNETLFYSRRIGRSPSLAQINGDERTATASPIAAAAKLTGRTRGGLTFGLLEAVTQRVPGVGGQTAEPRTNYGVVRANQDLRDGEGGISVIATATHRELDASTRDYLNEAAFSVGATFRNRFWQRNYEVSGQLAATRIDGTAAALTRAQRAPQRYYQRPGDGRAVDTTATSMTGMTGQLKVGKYGGGITRFETSLIHFTPGFESNDLGFLRRADLTNWSTWGALSWREQRWIYRWAQLNGNYWLGWNGNNSLFDHGVNANGHMGLRNNWDVHLGGTLSNIGGITNDRDTRGGPDVAGSPRFDGWGGVNTDGRRRISGGLWFNAGRADEGNSHYIGTSPYVTFRPSTRATLSLSFDYSNETSDRQYVGTVTDTVGTHYGFAHLDRITAATGVRFNYTATRNLTLELYAAPFETHGRFGATRELSATPEASRYADRYQPYTPAPGDEPEDFKVLDLRGNAVVRWEFRPGSTLFVVWQHSKQDVRTSFADQSWQNDYRDLFALQPNNTFLVKVAYWFSR